METNEEAIQKLQTDLVELAEKITTTISSHLDFTNEIFRLMEELAHRVSALEKILVERN